MRNKSARTGIMGSIRAKVPLLITLLIGIVFWNIPQPEGIPSEGWHLLAVFIGTIVGIVLKAMPMGALAIIALAIVTATRTLTVTEAFSGFSSGSIWLIVCAFFIARGFIKTGLGMRIAYYFVKMFGKSSLGLGYSLVASEFCLSPATPSQTARNGGVIFPILNSLSQALGSKPNDKSSKDLGEFLILTSYQCTAVMSAMFLTAMAANPKIQEMAGDLGVKLTWGGWALATIVPGIIALIVLPFVIYKISNPRIKKLPNAPELAKEKLAEMGSVTTNEKIMLIVFVGLIGLWIAGPMVGLSSLTVALLGLSALLITDVLIWQDKL